LQNPKKSVYSDIQNQCIFYTGLYPEYTDYCCYFPSIVCVEVIILAEISLPKIPNCETETTVMKTNLVTGEIIYEKSFRGSRSGGGWIMMFTDLGMEIVEKCPSPTTLRVFLYLSMGQTFTGGMSTTKLDVERKLGISHKACADAFRWLKHQFIIHEWRSRGCTDFMVNPRYVSVGRFDERIKLWNARWDYKPMYSDKSYQRKKSREFEQQQQSGG